MTTIGLIQRLVVRMTSHSQFTLTATPLPPLPTTTTAASFFHFNLRSSTTMSAGNSNLDSIFKHKNTLRSKVKKELKSMDPALRSKEDDAIQRIVLEAPWFKSCKILCAYITCLPLREVDTSKLLSEILNHSHKDDNLQVTKKLYVPRIEDKHSHMRMLNISKMDDLIPNSMNILEPSPIDAEGNERENVMLSKEPVDLFLLPGLAFDKSGRRLGRGGGYYDAFLTSYQELAEARKWKKPLFVALSYSVQILEDDIIPITPNDVYVDALVTSSGIIPISQAATEISS